MRISIGLQLLKEKTVENVTAFVSMEIDEQRQLLASKEKAKKKQVESYIRGICDLIRNISSDVKLIKYLILLLDGIIEGIFPYQTILIKMIVKDYQFLQDFKK